MMSESESEGEEKEVWVCSGGAYLGEISALCFLHPPLAADDDDVSHSHSSSSSPPPYLLAGTGSELLLYDLHTAKLVKSFHVYHGVRVHGITVSSADDDAKEDGFCFTIAVFGERRVKLFSLTIAATTSQNHNQPGTGGDELLCIRLRLLHLLPKFTHWVLDVCFFKENATSSLGQESRHFVGVGCSDNSVSFWSPNQGVTKVTSPDRCLLYSMRMWADNTEFLRIASGTIFNQIIVWKVVPVSHGVSRGLVNKNVNMANSYDETFQLHVQKYEAVHICRLAGHEGSIFRLDWSCDGNRLISVSDDRSARLWEVHECRQNLDCSVEIFDSNSVGPALFGHSARVWDCCIFDDLIVTAGEDCTCRVWGPDGNQLMIIKEHIGRGIWRCLYDPRSSLLVTAGFDSSIKAHHLSDFLLKTSGRNSGEVTELTNRTMNFTVCIPRSSEHAGLRNSKSEYVRCLRFACENVLYVATNNGYLYHAKLSKIGDVKWTELVRVTEAVAIVCMDVLSVSSSNSPHIGEDWVACGDGKGHMTIVSIVNDDCTPKVSIPITWPAGIERQLLGTYWCKSLGSRFIFTSDPRGTLRLWRLVDPLRSVSCNSMRNCNVSLVAKFVSCFGVRIMCLDASFEQEVVVCGDLRGNLVLFPLSKHLLLATSVEPEAVILTFNHFKSAHGISSVCSISLACFSSSQVEIQSTGGDGCICYLDYNRSRQSLVFLGMKQVKELSLVQCVSRGISSNDLTSGSYVIGFSSTNFLIWNLMTDTKVAQVPCGGWRRPYSYYLGDIPEIQNCFAFVKDEIIYVHRYWIHDSERKIYPQNLHVQFHGREMHSVCFISEDSLSDPKQVLFSKPCWIATGCEDGTVRLTGYDPHVGEWCESKLLGEHVGGSSVRSLCYVSTVHEFTTELTAMPAENTMQLVKEHPSLLISVGAKRVLTCWKQKSRTMESTVETAATKSRDESCSGIKPQSELLSSMSFQWLSSDMPVKRRSLHEEKERVAAENLMESDVSFFSKDCKLEVRGCLGDGNENDWRYLAVTAFLVNVAHSRLSVCFVVVSCSDATLALRALLLPYRLWFDVASLVPQSSPILALHHAVLPMSVASHEHVQIKSVYLVIGGSTDGNITFWDLSESVENYIHSLSAFQVEKFVEFQQRPRTGRGSQGGRWWKARDQNISAMNTSSTTTGTAESTGRNGLKPVLCGSSSESTDTESGETICSERRVWPSQVLNGVHQSGVNCLHISNIQNKKGSNSCDLYCVLSGGDDQAMDCLVFDLQMPPVGLNSEDKHKEKICDASNCGSTKNYIHFVQHPNYNIRFCYRDKVASAHSSALKGIWTDGSWVFSTGLDQRIRCWHLDEHGKITERASLTISVPEPEALDARLCGKDSYQIIIAGRGMQIVDFSTLRVKC